MRYAFRLLRKSPGFVSVAIGTLALGIGANSVIFSGVSSFILRPLPVPDSERIVFLRSQAKTGARYAVSYPDLMEWRATAKALEYTAGVQIETFNVTGGGEAERLRGSRVTADFFKVFGISPAAGRSFSETDDRPGAAPVVVLSHNLAQRKFGGTDAMGRTLNLDGRPHSIIGVMPPQMSFPMGFAELWVALATDETRHGRGDHFLAGVGKLRSGSTFEQAKRQLETIAAQIASRHPDSNKDMGIYINTLADQIGSGPKQSILMLWVAVAFVLLICCANLANLTLARAVHRSREFAIRQALGASRWQMLRHVLIESTILSLAGGAFGLMLAGWGIDLVSSRLPPMFLPMGGLSLDVPVLIFTVALSIGTGLIFGLLPAIRTLRSQAADALREGGRAIAGGRVHNRTANALVIGEVALAVMLLGGAGLLLAAMARMQGAETGFSPDHVLTAEIAAKGGKYDSPQTTYLTIDDLLRRLKSTPGVTAAAAINFPPMTHSTSRAYSVDGKPPVDRGRIPMADYRVATPDYASAMRIAMRHGRFLSEEDKYNGALVAVVNQRFADREWPGQNPIGREISLYTGPGQLGPWRTVVGVIANVRDSGPAADPNAAIYLPFSQQTESQLYVVVRTSGNPAAFAETLRSITKSVDADLPLSLVRPMERVMADALAPARFTTGLLAIFSALALMLAAMGLYGVISYLVARRTHEFGVRIAMGATPALLLKLVLRRSLALTGTGTVLGLAGAFAVTRLLAALIRGVRPDAEVFIGVATVLGVVATVAAWVPLRRALAAGPLESLRSE